MMAPPAVGFCLRFLRRNWAKRRSLLWREFALQLGTFKAPGFVPGFFVVLSRLVE